MVQIDNREVGKMRLALFSSILFSLISMPCSSPLSDTNVTDPSLLEPEMSYFRSVTLN